MLYNIITIDEPLQFAGHTFGQKINVSRLHIKNSPVKF